MEKTSERFEALGELDPLLTQREWSVLIYICSSEHVTLGQAAKFAKISKSSATIFINKFESMCCVKRIHESEDRRFVSLEVTAEGYKACGKYLSERRTVVKSYLNQLISESQVQLVSLLEELLRLNKKNALDSK